MPARYDRGPHKIIHSFRAGGLSVGARLWLTDRIETREHQNFDHKPGAAVLAQSQGLLNSSALPARSVVVPLGTPLIEKTVMVIENADASAGPSKKKREPQYTKPNAHFPLQR